MKKLIIAFSILYFLVVIQAATHAQTSGTIFYDETVKLNIDMKSIKIDAGQDPMTQQIMSQLPKEQKQPKVLYFTQDESLFENVEAKSKQDDLDQGSGGTRVMINLGAPNDIIYVNIKDKKLIEQQDFMSRKFLITDEQEKQPWRLTGNQKTILNYPCQEAVLMKEKDTITAWFTASIPVATGPNGWYGLPGIILEGSQNHTITFQATKVDLGNTDTDKITAPKKGKKVTEKEFNAIVTQKQKEMSADGNGGNNVIIKINR